MEHRWGQRRNVHQPVHVRTVGGMAAQGHITSVSISGAFLNTPLSAPLLAVIQVCFVAQRGRARVSPTIAGQVVRKTADGLGVEWCEFAPDVAYALGAVPTQLDHIVNPASATERTKK